MKQIRPPLYKGRRRAVPTATAHRHAWENLVGQPCGGVSHAPACATGALERSAPATHRNEASFPAVVAKTKSETTLEHTARRQAFELVGQEYHPGGTWVQAMTTPPVGGCSKTTIESRSLAGSSSWTARDSLINRASEGEAASGPMRSPAHSEMIDMMCLL